MLGKQLNLRARWTGIAGLVALFVVVLFAHRSWRYLQDHVVLSCAKGIAAALEEVEASEFGVNWGKEWRAIEPHRWDKLASRIQPADCTESEKRQDRWGNRLVIAARRMENGALQFMVWSFGADRAPHTSDDLIVPAGEMPPTVH